jgi:hypothetical protein
VQFRHHLALKYAIEADENLKLSENPNVDPKLQRRYGERALIYMKLMQDEQKRCDSFDMAAANKKAMSLVRQPITQKLKRIV